MLVVDDWLTTMDMNYVYFYWLSSQEAVLTDGGSMTGEFQ